MKKWIWISMGVAVVLLGAVGYYLFRAGVPIPSGTAPDLMTLAPADSNAIFFVDFASLRKGPFGPQLSALANSSTSGEYRDFVANTNFHYDTDLDHILLAASTDSPNSAAIVLEGRFDQAKIKDYAAKKGTTSHNQEGDVYLFPTNTGGEGLAMMILGPNRVAFASGAGAETEVLVLAAIAKDKNLQAREDLRSRAQRVSGAQVFGVGDIPKISQMTVASLAQPGASDAAQLLETLNGWDFAAWMDGDTLRLAMEFECSTNMDALRVRIGVEELMLKLKLDMAAAKKAKGNRSDGEPDYDALAKGFEASLDGRFVRLSLALPKEELAILGMSLPKGSLNPGMN